MLPDSYMIYTASNKGMRLAKDGHIIQTNGIRPCHYIPNFSMKQNVKIFIFKTLTRSRPTSIGSTRVSSGSTNMCVIIYIKRYRK